MRDITGATEEQVVKEIAEDLVITDEDNPDMMAELRKAVHEDFVFASHRGREA